MAAAAPASQVRIHLTTRTEDIQLPDTGPILVSTGKLKCRVPAHISIVPEFSTAD
jgi:hypothetical protein